MSLVQSRFYAIEASYKNDVLKLVVAREYVAKLIGNRAVASYLRPHHADLAEGFPTIVASTSLEGGAVG